MAVETVLNTSVPIEVTVPVVELIKPFTALATGIDDVVVVAACDKLEAVEPNAAVVVPSDELTATVAAPMEAVDGVAAPVGESPGAPLFETEAAVAAPESLLSFAS